MRRRRIVFALIAVVGLCGCNAYDMLFGMIGQYHTAGGESAFPGHGRREHFFDEVERWERHHATTQETRDVMSLTE